MLRVLSIILKKFHLDERGAVLVEMTLITPLMISLSAGVFEFGNLIHQKFLIEAGLRDAARYAARCNPTFSGLNCETIAKNIAATGTVDGTGAARVVGWAAADVTVDRDYLTIPVTTDAFGNQNYRSSGANIYAVRVNTSFTYSGVSLLAYLGLSPITLTGAHEERVIGW
jgi:Flp pilus assembly protein TadG